MAPGVAATATAADPAKAKGSQPWYELESTCIFCQKDDYACEYGPRSLLLCSCCPKGTHVECYEKAKGIELTEDFIDSGSSWFCSKVRICFGMAQCGGWFQHLQQPSPSAWLVACVACYAV